jgi:hypothetical protein
MTTIVMVFVPCRAVQGRPAGLELSLAVAGEFKC